MGCLWDGTQEWGVNPILEQMDARKLTVIELNMISLKVCWQDSGQQTSS
jgi:hypothetical protein